VETGGAEVLKGAVDMADAGTMRLRIQRFDPSKEAVPHFQTFEVPRRPGLTVLDGLFYILERLDGSLAFRYSCRSAICGSCAMTINGAPRLACQTLVEGLGRGEIAVKPLPHLTVERDLAVDLRPFFAAYERIRPYLLATSAAPAKERLQGPAERRAIDEMTMCILCASCYASCQVVWTSEEYLGPQALLMANRFVQDSRDGAKEERLDHLANEEGIWRCHTMFNCVVACPKNLNPTWSIQQLKRRAAKRRLTGRS